MGGCVNVVRVKREHLATAGPHELPIARRDRLLDEAEQAVDLTLHSVAGHAAVPLLACALSDGVKHARARRYHGGQPDREGAARAVDECPAVDGTAVDG